jgi:hypothetical protein
MADQIRRRRKLDSHALQDSCTRHHDVIASFMDGCISGPLVCVPMMIQAKLESLKGIKLHEWAVRFFFGGTVCVLAGLVSKRFGPEIGGLFLAFPAIFPAGASMVEAHEKKHKARVGFDGTIRGRTVAGLDAAGAAMGCVGLIGFAVSCWLSLPLLGIASVFVLATMVWVVLSFTVWLLCKSRIFRNMRGQRRALHAFHNS